MSNQSKALLYTLSTLAFVFESVYNAGKKSAPHIKAFYAFVCENAPKWRDDTVAYYQLYVHEHLVNGLKASVAATIVAGQYAASTAATLYANRKQIRNSVESLFVYRNTPALA